MWEAKMFFHCLRIFVRVVTLVVLVTGFPMLIGCSGTMQASASPAFEWVTERPVPRWRQDSPIEWYGTHQRDEVFEESRLTGKPILCYVSYYIDIYHSEDLETEVLSLDGWGEAIKEHFVTWEVNWWEDPALGLLISGSAGQTLIGRADTIPSLIALRPPVEDSESIRVIDIWADWDLAYFPAHNGKVLIPHSTEGRSELDRITREPGRPIDYSGGYLVTASPENIEDIIAHAQESLGEGRRGIELCLYSALEELITGTEIPGLEVEIESWASLTDPYSDTELLHGLSFDFGPFFSAWPYGFYVPGNLQVAVCAVAQGADWPVAPENLFRELYSMVSVGDGRLGGGFPPYLDDRETFVQHEDQTLLDAILYPDDGIYPLHGAVPGPRDLVWANAQALSMWLELVMWEPSLKGIALPSGQTTGAFLDEVAPVLVEALEQKVSLDEPDSTALADRIHMMHLYNVMYQMTGNTSLLENAGAIAATFHHDRKDDWYDVAFVPLMPDLALALHHYGWLASDENSRTTARFLPEESISLMLIPGSSIATEHLLYAYKVVNAKCIHIAVVASVDDPAGQALLSAALEGWDPRKIAQILDPERDAELIERKGLIPMDEAVAYVCVDDDCLPPVRDPDELRDLIKEVQADLVIESEDQGNDNGVD